MKNKLYFIYYLILFILSMHASPLGAQEETLNSEFQQNSDFLQNPFLSQLPKEPEPDTSNTSQTNARSTSSEETNRYPQTPTHYRNSTPPITSNTNTAVEPEPIVLPNVTVLGMIWNSNRPQAIINGVIVDIGDIVEEMTIVNIEKMKIDVLYQNQAFTIDTEPQRNP